MNLFYQKLHIMKRLFYFLFVIFILGSCKDKMEPHYSYPDLFDPKNEKELIKEMIREDGVKTAFYYDDSRKLLKREEYLPPQILINEYQYDSLERITKSLDYDGDTYLGESIYNNYNDSIEKIVYRIRNEKLIILGKTTFKYNSSGYMVHADVYLPNEDGSWEKVAYYIFDWDNQNLKYSEVWGPLNSNLVYKTGSRFINDLKLFEYWSNRSQSDNKNEIVKLQEKAFYYDSKVNPLRAITAGKVILPFEIVCSKNNVIESNYSDVYDYSEDRSYIYEYNNYQHPVFVKMKWDSNSSTGELNWDYFYKKMAK